MRVGILALGLLLGLLAALLHFERAAYDYGLTTLPVIGRLTVVELLAGFGFLFIIVGAVASPSRTAPPRATSAAAAGLRTTTAAFPSTYYCLVCGSDWAYPVKSIGVQPDRCPSCGFHEPMRLTSVGIGRLPSPVPSDQVTSLRALSERFYSIDPTGSNVPPELGNELSNLQSSIGGAACRFLDARALEGGPYHLLPPYNTGNVVLGGRPVPKKCPSCRGESIRPLHFWAPPLDFTGQEEVFRAKVLPPELTPEGLSPPSIEPRADTLYHTQLHWLSQCDQCGSILRSTMFGTTEAGPGVDEQ